MKVYAVISAVTGIDSPTFLSYHRLPSSQLRVELGWLAGFFSYLLFKALA